MEFAVPAALAGGLLALPVAALFLVRPQPRPHRVATLMFWTAAAPATRRRVAWGRVRNPLALAVALTTLGLIVLAAAAPFPARAGDTPARVVLVVDNSIGMRATDVTPTRLARAATAARGYVTALRPGQTAAVVTAGGRPRVACGLTDDPGALAGAIAGVGPTDAPRQLPAAVALARRLAAGGRVVVISGSPTRPPGDDIEWVPVGTAVGNLAVTAFQPRRDGGGPEFELLVEVTNAGPAAAETRLEVSLDGNLLDAIPIALGPGEAWRRVLRKAADGGGRLHATLAAADVLGADDEAWAVLPPTDLLPVTFVPVAATPADDAVRAALEELPFLRKPVAVSADAEVLRAGSVAVFHRRLPAALPPGPVLVIDPPAGSELWDLTDPVAEPHPRVKDATSPLLARLTLPRDALGKPRGIRPKADARVVIEAASGEPVVVEFPRAEGRGRVVVFAVDLEAGGLRYSPTFVALLGTALQHLGRVRADVPESPTAGETTTAELPPGGPYELRPPGGSPQPVRPGTTAVVGPLDRAGVWAIGPAGQSGVVWSVAPRPAGAADADLRPADADAGSRTGGGYLPPWAWLAVAALGLLVIEWVAYHRRWIV